MKSFSRSPHDGFVPVKSFLSLMIAFPYSRCAVIDVRFFLEAGIASHGFFFSFLCAKDKRD